MDTRNKIITIAKEAIQNGFGNYFALYKTTWNDVLSGYNAGKRVDQVSEEILLQALAIAK